MFNKILTLAVAASSLWSIQSQAQTAWNTFTKPYYGAQRLDWCLNWGTDCGAPAANAYCKWRGYRGDVSSSAIDPDIGNTRLISTGAVCDQAFCDGFTHVSCKYTSMTYPNPTQGDRRLDWCQNWATNCGAPAANQFCRSKGFDVASSFAMAADIGNTRLIGTGAICDQSFCDGFTSIVCK